MTEKMSRSSMIKYITDRLVPTHIPGLYEGAIKGFIDYVSGDEPSRDNKLNLVVLASGYLATLTYLKRNICDQELGTHNDLWSAFIDVHILGKAMFFSDKWDKILKKDKELIDIVNKTSNPERTLIALKGFSYKELFTL